MSSTIHAPGRVTSVLGMQPWWGCGTPDQRRALAQAVRDSRQRAENRLARVRAHPDLAEQLCQALGYDHLGQWSGYVPPTREASSGTGLNRCPRRRALVEILNAVADRDQGDQETEA